MTEAHLTLQTIYGMIEEEWHIENGLFHLSITVPVNTHCTVILPDGAEHIVGSGKYAFQCKYCMKEEK